MQYPSIKLIQERVAEHYGCTVVAMLSARMTQSLVRPRQIAMYLAREMTLHSLPEIGRLFNRERKTIEHGCQAVEQRLAWDLELIKEIYAIRQGIDAEAASWEESPEPSPRPPRESRGSGAPTSFFARWDGPLPKVGEWLVPARGRRVYQVKGVEERPEDPWHPYCFNIQPHGELPAGAVTHPWEWSQRGL